MNADRKLLAGLFLVCSALAPAQSAGLRGSISGRVVNATSGDPIRRAEVRIVVEDHADIWGMTSTDADGRYLLRELPAGKYRITVSKQGYGPMEYGARRPWGEGRVITLSAGENRMDVLFRLPHLGVITGTVIGPDGEPMPMASVQAMRRQYPRGKVDWVQSGFAATDDRGQFRMRNLMPGTYVVAAMGQGMRRRFPVVNFPDNDPNRPREDAEPPMTVVNTYAPGVVSRSQARQIELNSGQEIGGVDINLVELRPLKLEVSGHFPFAAPEPEAANGPSEPGRPRERVTAQLQIHEVVDGIVSGPAFGSAFVPGGRSEFPNIAPGRYLVVGSVTFEGKTYSARQTVDLTSADADVTLQFAPPVDLAGHLTLEGPGVGAVSGHSVYLVSGDRVSRASNELRAQVGADGAFVLKNVPPGLWDIGIDPLPKGGFYKLMQLGDADVLRKEMIIDSESKGPLNIVVSSAGAELSGEVEGGAATAVLAVPIGVNEHVFTFDVVTDVDEQGAFRFHGLMPGAYRIFAFEDLVPWSWMNEKFASRIEGLGTAVELPEGGRASIKVQVIRGTTGEM